VTSPFTMLAGAGFTGWLILLTGLLYLVALTAQWRSPGRRNLLPLLWALFAATLIFGLFGQTMGQIQYDEALAHASMEMRDTLAAAGAQIYLFSMGSALCLAVPMAVANGAAALRIKQHTGAPQPIGGS